METHKEWIGGLKSRVSPLKPLANSPKSSNQSTEGRIRKRNAETSPHNGGLFSRMGRVGGRRAKPGCAVKSLDRRRKWPGAESNCRHADFQLEGIRVWEKDVLTNIGRTADRLARMILLRRAALTTAESRR